MNAFLRIVHPVFATSSLEGALKVSQPTLSVSLEAPRER